MQTVKIPLTQHEYDTLTSLAQECGVTLEEFLCSLASSFYFDKRKGLDIFCKALFLIDMLYPERAGIGGQL
jgi:hypothetical protein